MIYINLILISISWYNNEKFTVIFFCSCMLIEYKECFNLYDRDNDGLISIEQMRQVIRSLGQCPSERELKEVQEKLGEFHFLQSMIFYYLLFSLTLVLNN